MNLMVLLLIFTMFFAAVKADDSYYPCKSYISFSYDDSNALNNDDFKTQMNFIRSVVSTLNYPNRLRAEGGYTGEFNWNSGLNIGQMQINLHNAQQNPMPYSLSQQAASLLTSIEVLENNQNIPIAAIIFVSDTSDSALKNADRWFNRLSGIHITFVMLGLNVNSVKLRKYSNNFIFWQDLALTQPDNWDLLFNTAFGCGNSPVQTTTSGPYRTTNGWFSTLNPITWFTQTYSTMAPPYTYHTASTESPYYPCQSWISFSIDSSSHPYYSNFNLTDFYTEIGFISNIIGDFNHPERIQVTSTGGTNVQWNSYSSIKAIQTTVLGINLYDAYNLRYQFKLLVTALSSFYFPPNNVATIIFISDTSDDALLGADQYMPYLRNVRITFVLLGPDADSSKLTQFSSNFVYWTDLYTSQPDNWDYLKNQAYGC